MHNGYKKMCIQSAGTQMHPWCAITDFSSRRTAPHRNVHDAHVPARDFRLVFLGCWWWLLHRPLLRPRSCPHHAPPHHPHFFSTTNNKKKPHQQLLQARWSLADNCTHKYSMSQSTEHRKHCSHLGFAWCRLFWARCFTLATGHSSRNCLCRLYIGCCWLGSLGRLLFSRLPKASKKCQKREPQTCPRPRNAHKISPKSSSFWSW